MGSRALQTVNPSRSQSCKVRCGRRRWSSFRSVLFRCGSCRFVPCRIVRLSLTLTSNAEPHSDDGPTPHSLPSFPPCFLPAFLSSCLYSCWSRWDRVVDEDDCRSANSTLVPIQTGGPSQIKTRVVFFLLAGGRDHASFSNVEICHALARQKRRYGERKGQS